MFMQNILVTQTPLWVCLKIGSSFSPWKLPFSGISHFQTKPIVMKPPGNSQAAEALEVSAQHQPHLPECGSRSTHGTLCNSHHRGSHLANVPDTSADRWHVLWVSIFTKMCLLTRGKPARWQMGMADATSRPSHGENSDN